ncbi:MAG TPA: hypothetical protein VMH83_10115, partial [Candidatus Acidoferrum sp.]|nr:hypothetical protein [Candidatus Acidoferrum sp.]
MSHNFSFFRVGGFNQVRLATGADLQHLDQLDQKLWVALACPVQGLEFDARTLTLIDSDGDGRIRAGELIAAVQWACRLLKDANELVRAPSELALTAIDDVSDDGKQLVHAIKTVLVGLGKPGAPAISVEETAAALQAFQAMPFNGDGVISVDAAASAADQQTILDAIACVGSVADSSGKDGIDAAKLAEFAQALNDYLMWADQAQADRDLQPLQGDTAAAVAALNDVKTKIDDYFVRCQLAAFDARAIAALNREEKEYYALAAKDLVITSDEIRVLPLAQIAANAPLPLANGLNPAWRAAMEAFAATVVKPLLGQIGTLTETQWQQIKTTLGRFENWQAGKSGIAVEKLGLDRVRELVTQNVAQRLQPLFDQESAQANTAAAIASVERLARYV